jgi:hypothetical protein
VAAARAEQQEAGQRIAAMAAQSLEWATRAEQSADDARAEVERVSRSGLRGVPYWWSRVFNCRELSSP